MLLDGIGLGPCITYFINACETEVSILSNFTILSATNFERSIPGGMKFFLVCEIHCQGDSLSTKPIQLLASIAPPPSNTQELNIQRPTSYRCNQHHRRKEQLGPAYPITSQDPQGSWGTQSLQFAGRHNRLRRLHLRYS